MNGKIQRINGRNFGKFGRVIGYAGKAGAARNKNLFSVVLRERKPFGWRIACLVVRERSIARLECHDESFESFEPINGRGLLFVSDKKEHGSIRCFLLDRPVVLYKGVWHGIVTVDRETEVKISENAKVRCLYWRLGRGVELSVSGIKSRRDRKKTR
ncbi:MAG: hypothetical protein PHR11_07060 [Candidatus Omnitrophica bacterium]|nr:hypothetical protein [Candidatus Omnitrophota bacterium]